MPPAQLSTRNITDVSVLPMYGDPLLNHEGIGHINFDGPQVKELRCGPFAVHKPIPTAGESYVITGSYDKDDPERGGMAFKYTLKCTAAGRPTSTFA